MTDELVPTVRTVIPAAAMYAALQAAWAAQIGTPAPRASLLVLLSQWSLETGNGQASMNNNVGGLKHVAGDGHDYATYETHEVLHGVDTVLKQSFRAYATLQAGVDDYLHELRHTFGFAWPGVEAGDVADFAHRLKQRAYFTASEHSYAAGLQARYAQLDKAIPSDDVLPDVIAASETEPNPYS